MKKLIYLFLVFSILILTGCITIKQADEVSMKPQSVKLYGDLRERIGRLEARVENLEKIIYSGAKVNYKLGKVLNSEVKNKESNQARYGGVLRLILMTDPPTLDPALTTDTTSSFVVSQMYDGLVDLDKNLNVVPAIAKSWDINSKTEYVFHLRKGVKFHSGREVKASDFRYSYLRILNPKTRSPRMWLFEKVVGYKTWNTILKLKNNLKLYLNNGKREKLDEVINIFNKLVNNSEFKYMKDNVKQSLKKIVSYMNEYLKVRQEQILRDILDILEKINISDVFAYGFEAKDDYTFIIRLREPFSPFLAVLTMTNAAVVDRNVIENYGQDWASKVSAGTGAFKFDSWQHDVVLKLKAFKDHFRGRPYVDEVIFKIIKDEVTAFTEFEVGNVDILRGIPDSKYKYVTSSPKWKGCYQEKPVLATFYIGFNVKKKPFDNVLIRKAFNYAIDKAKIVERVREGRAVVARGILPPSLPGAVGNKNYPYDVEKAKELLAKAGYPGGVGLPPVELWYNTTESNAKIAEVVQYYLKKIGIDVKLRNIDWGTYLKKIDSGDCPMFRLGWVADYPDAENFLYILFYSKNAGANGNYCFYSNSKVDKLLEEARRQTDDEKRYKMYEQIESMIMNDAVWIPIYHNKDLVLYQKNVRGVVLTAMGADRIALRKVWLEGR